MIKRSKRENPSQLFLTNYRCKSPPRQSKLIPKTYDEEDASVSSEACYLKTGFIMGVGNLGQREIEHCSEQRKPWMNPSRGIEGRLK